jgi:hypothetical protein
MDLHKAIQDLYAEKERLERVIASLESLEGAAPPLASPPMLHKPAKRRGRKSMNVSERQDVSIRMKKYWASRRKASESARDSESRTGRE